MTTINIPIGEVLKRRRKKQKLTFEEKREIYKQIEEGRSVRDIREIYQISKSTI